MKKFIIYHLSFIIFLLFTFYFLLNSPVYAQDESSDSEDESPTPVQCNDEYGNHDIGAQWTGQCDADHPGYKFRYYCDNFGNRQISTGGYIFDSMCGEVPTPAPGGISTSSIKSIFGEIKPPAELNPFIQKGGAGAGGISLFLNNLIALIYLIAGIVFIFMLLWGAMQWLMSGGEKEAVAAARGRITNALIGIVLFGIAFAVIKVVGNFTGFQFTARQDPSCSQRETYYLDQGKCKHVFYTGASCTAIFEDADRSLCQ